MPYLSIEEVHRSEEAFVCQRTIDWLIYFDLFLILSHLPYWIEFSSKSDQADLQAAADKLKLALILCVAPFTVVKVLLRFWAKSDATMQLLRCAILMYFLQVPMAALLVTFDRRNCGEINWFGDSDDDPDGNNGYFCYKMLPDLKG